MSNPKGKLLIIGGSEDKGEEETPDMQGKNKEFERFEVLRKVLPGGSKEKIELITTGSEMPEEVQKKYKKAFQKIGYPHLDFIPIKNKMEARDEGYIKRMENAGAVFFSGGDQFRLSTILGGTPIIETIKRRYYEDPDFIAAGTSAGAMVMSKIMITEGGTNEALLKSDLKTSSGFGMLEYCIIDTHFIMRGRFGRLAQAVIINPGQLGVGLGEDTALIIKNGSDAICTGSGMVVIIDGTDIQQTNITEVEKDKPIFVENLRVHLLVKDCRFDLKARELENPAINPRAKTEFA
jgi:cyanophycinase